MSAQGTNTRLCRTEVCCLATARRVAAMLDLDADGLRIGSPLPRGWHFTLLAGETRRSALRKDGFPGLGITLPDLKLPRVVLGGRTVEYSGDIDIGSTVDRTSSLESVEQKTGKSGPVTIVKFRHELRGRKNPESEVVELQTYLLLTERATNTERKENGKFGGSPNEKTLTPDETLLFQYSALGFNTHKIHIDRTYACEVEGFPDLVVNGGLTSLLLTEFLRNELGQKPVRIKAKHIAPLFCRRPMTLTAHLEGDAWRLRAFDSEGWVAVEIEATVQ